MSAERLSEIRDRMLPMMQVAAGSISSGCPVAIRTLSMPSRMGPSGSRSIRATPLRDLEWQRPFAGSIAAIRAPTTGRAPAARSRRGAFLDRRPLSANVDDQTLRNLIAELMSYFNQQPGLIHITDD